MCEKLVFVCSFETLVFVCSFETLVFVCSFETLVFVCSFETLVYSYRVFYAIKLKMASTSSKRVFSAIEGILIMFIVKADV